MLRISDNTSNLFSIPLVLRAFSVAIKYYYINIYKTKKMF